MICNITQHPTKTVCVRFVHVVWGFYYKCTKRL